MRDMSNDAIRARLGEIGRRRGEMATEDGGHFKGAHIEEDAALVEEYHRLHGELARRERDREGTVTDDSE